VLVEALSHAPGGRGTQGSHRLRAISCLPVAILGDIGRAPPKCCAPQLPRQFGEGEHVVFAGDIVPKTLELFLQQSTKHSNMLNACPLSRYLRERLPCLSSILTPSDAATYGGFRCVRTYATTKSGGMWSLLPILCGYAKLLMRWDGIKRSAHDTVSSCLVSASLS